MAGSTIYHIETEAAALTEPMTMDDILCTGFIGNIANYVDDDIDSAADIRDLAESLEGSGLAQFQKDEDGAILSITFQEGFREWYFRDRYVDFMAKLAQVQALASPQSFATRLLDTPLYLLGQAHTNDYSRYVYSCDEISTFDAFVRHIQYGVPNYFGTTIYYHS